MINNFLSSTKKQFEYYKLLGFKTMEQLSDEQLFQSPHPDGNSLATIVKHLAGNMLSRWTDFLTSDGEKEWRQRDDEFECNLSTRKEVYELWNKGWDCLFEALDSVHQENFNTTIYIRNMGHTITEAVHRQMGHYAYHVGQMVLLGKIFKADEWQSLSIPKGNSKDYNAEKFSKPKRNQHFTDDLIDGKTN
ncbi:MAG: DUF1572 family protein [Flavobacteriales bacterium]